MFLSLPSGDAAGAPCRRTPAGTQSTHSGKVGAAGRNVSAACGCGCSKTRRNPQKTTRSDSVSPACRRRTASAKSGAIAIVYRSSSCTSEAPSRKAGTESVTRMAVDGRIPKRGLRARHE